MIKRVTYPKNSVSWLGLTEKSLKNECRRRFTRSISYQNKTICSKLTDSSTEYFDGSVSSLSEGQLYPCCIEAEMTVNELLLDEVKLARVYAKWSSTMDQERARVERFFNSKNPSHVILVQGYEPTSWFARELAITREIPLLSLENTALNHKLVWDSCSGIVVNRNAAKNYFWRYWDCVSESEVLPWFRELEEKTAQYKSNEHTSPANMECKLGRDKPIILFIGQVFTDSSILFGSGQWKSPLELISSALKEAIKLGAILVVKLHPKEASGRSPLVKQPYAKLTYRKMLSEPFLKGEIELGENILVDHENCWNTYGLMQEATCAVTMNSQAGLEAQVRGVPTIVCGHAFYDGLGFTCHAGNRQDLATKMAEALSTGECSERTYRARLFAYIYFEKYCMEKSEASVVEKLLSI
ncbi:hypothetical protein BSZ32_03555 [Rubritalea profundi]|uniref:Capsule polysaccharide biosynthesis protein n=2 Tax=Rubritalea profundi TaxID=1658618 RepID=A0A2S7TZU9_9BACT|nr:hypothetical protein BSZ32_03555 [Rubritalea profundi]